MYQVIFSIHNKVISKRFKADDLESAVLFCNKVNGRLRLRTEKLRVVFP